MSDQPVLDIEAQPVNNATLLKPETALVNRRANLKGTIYLLLDCSASMGCAGKLAQLKRGSLRFFAEAWKQEYAIGAIGFGSRAFPVLGATRNVYLFQKRIMSLAADGRTAMDSAIRLGTWRLRFRRGHRVLMLITDGQPDYPEATLQAACVARKLGIELIVIGTSGADEVFLSALTPKPELMEYVDKSALEESMASAAVHLP
jgi:Mg-chelatase subunit ChlD